MRFVKSTVFRSIILSIFFSFLLLPKLSNAACVKWSDVEKKNCVQWSDDSGLVNPLGDNNTTVEGLLNSIVNWLLVIATPIAVGMIIFGAFQMMFAGGDPEKFKNGKMTILYTAIGYAIILIGEGITLIIKDLLNG